VDKKTRMLEMSSAFQAESSTALGKFENVAQRFYRQIITHLAPSRYIHSNDRNQ
jgi:hypothetical protein